MRRQCVAISGPRGGRICADEVRTNVSIDLIVFRDGPEIRVYDSERSYLLVLREYGRIAPDWVR